MSAPLSIIIPTLNSQKSLGVLLPDLMAGVTEGLIRELIFADGGSEDETAEIAQGVGAVLIKGPRGRGSQLKEACEAAQGSWLLVLHSDSQLPDDWVRSVTSHMEHSDKAAVFRLSFDDRAFMAKWTAAWANLRTRVFGLPYGDQGLLISSLHYRKIGGYAAIPLMEDVAIAKALKGQITLLETSITTSAHRYHQEGWIRRGSKNLFTLLRYKLGRAPEALAKGYYGGNHKS